MTNPSSPLITTRLSVSPCPSCGAELDAASAPGVKPIPGDVSVCFYCATVVEFADDMSLKSVSEEELSKLDPETRRTLNQYVAAVRVHLLLMKL